VQLNRQEVDAHPRQAASSGRDEPSQEAIINAALEILVRDGYQRLTIRAIAEEARVNHAMISYYFGGKQKLLLAILQRLETEKFARQWAMYAEPGVPLSQKWRQAVQFFRDDLDDGFVPIQHEMQIAARRNPEVARFLEDMTGRWESLLVKVAAEMLPPLQIHLPPEDVVASLINFWMGMRHRVVDGGPEEEEQSFRFLNYIGDWLEDRERVCLGNGESPGT
jgi:AcrR family transcriptional regulator